MEEFEKSKIGSIPVVNRDGIPVTKAYSTLLHTSCKLQASYLRAKRLQHSSATFKKYLGICSNFPGLILKVRTFYIIYKDRK